MITTAEDYYGLLYKVQDKNAPSIAVLLPTDEKIYEVDLDTRQIEAPEYVSVSSDHLAEVIYFKCPRFYDGVDLAETTCVIEYINAKGKAYFYPVPFFDVSTYSTYNPETLEEEPHILFPWAIDSSVCAAAGKVQFAIRFYQLGGKDGTKLEYNISTLPAETSVLEGLASDLDYEEYTDTLKAYGETVLQYLKNASDVGVFWLDV